MGSTPIRIATFQIQPLLYASVAQLVEQGTENPRVVGSIPTGGTTCGFSSFGRAPPCQGGGGGFDPRNPLHLWVRIDRSYPLSFRRHHSQAVRQRSAKPSFPGPIPGGASKQQERPKWALLLFAGIMESAGSVWNAHGIRSATFGAPGARRNSGWCLQKIKQPNRVA